MLIDIAGTLKFGDLEPGFNSSCDCTLLLSEQQKAGTKVTHPRLVIKQCSL